MLLKYSIVDFVAVMFRNRFLMQYGHTGTQRTITYACRNLKAVHEHVLIQYYNTKQTNNSPASRGGTWMV